MCVCGGGVFVCVCGGGVLGRGEAASHDQCGQSDYNPFP